MARNVFQWMRRFNGNYGCSGFDPKGEVTPCDGLQGSNEKIKAMMARVQAGEPLWHPDDGDGADITDPEQRISTKQNRLVKEIRPDKSKKWLKK